MHPTTDHSLALHVEELHDNYLKLRTVDKHRIVQREFNTPTISCNTRTPHQ